MILFDCTANKVKILFFQNFVLLANIIKILHDTDQLIQFDKPKIAMAAAIFYLGKSSMIIADSAMMQP